MKCPVCGMRMVEKDFGGVLVDVCADGCKGMWFDWLEMSKLDEKNEGYGAALHEALKYPRINNEDRPPLKCPTCGIKMKTHRFKLNQQVNIDECYSCGRMFLDSGELKDIREKSMTDQENDEYLEKLLADIPEVQDARRDQEKDRSRANAMKNFTRFLRVSHYMTGE